MPDSGRKDLIPMKRPLAYITAPWSENEFENTENAAKYCMNKTGLNIFKIIYRCDRYDFVDFLATPLSKDWVYSEKKS